MNGKSFEDFLAFIEQIDSGAHRAAGGAQNIADAIRPVFFSTGCDEWAYATHGGTLYLIEYEGKLFGLTCEHVFGDFRRDQLFVVKDKFAKKGTPPARIKGFSNPSAPKDGAVGTDITDLCIIEFADDVTQKFFGGAAYVFNDKTVATARTGDRLLVAGVLKEKTSILDPDICIGYCRLEYQDAGVGTSDPFLREAKAEFPSPGFTSVVGLSGSPVFNRDQDRLCGMIMRGGMTGRMSSLFYLDAYDIAQALKAVRAGAGNTYYTKIIAARIE